MSASVGQVQTPPRRDVAAAKARRQKVLAIAAFVVLGVVLAIQVPRTLKLLDSHSAPASTTAAIPAPAGTATPAAPAAPSAPAAQKPAAVLSELRAAHAIDPFAKRVPSDRDAPPRAVGATPGTHDPFAKRGASDRDASPRAVTWPAGLRDPFHKPGVAATAGTIQQIVVGTRGHGAPKIGYIVVIASIPLSQGREAAVRFAANARRDGITSIGILNSSSRKPLRQGYWVVYIGSWKTVSAAEMTATAIHARAGYGEAYVRQLVRYG